MIPWFPLETKRLCLREFALEDETHILEYATDVEVSRFTQWGPNVAATKANLASRLIQQQVWPRDSIELAVDLCSDNHVIGIMRLSILDRNDGTADFGYTFNRRYWGQGYATEASRALLDVAFRHLELRRVWSTCDVRNHASYRVMEKLGMRREACFRKDVLQKRGSGETRTSMPFWPRNGSKMIPTTTSPVIEFQTSNSPVRFPRYPRVSSVETREIAHVIRARRP